VDSCPPGPGAAGADLSVARSLHSVRRNRCSIADIISVVTELDGEVVGGAVLHTTMPNVRRRHVMAFGISVAKPAHGKGVGTAIHCSSLSLLLVATAIAGGAQSIRNRIDDQCKPRRRYDGQMP
jgi:hypothetical protein